LNDKTSRTGYTLPGDKLAVIEECRPGLGTYEESGAIYSKYVGKSFLDPVKKIVMVKEIKTTLIPREESTVIGNVKSAQDRIAIISMFKIDDKLVSNTFTGILHISRSSPRYERVMYEVCKVGDIVKARVVNVKSRIPELTTVGEELGVIIAYCSKCGGLLVKGSNRLQCEVCGNRETRKTSSQYDENPW